MRAHQQQNNDIHWGTLASNSAEELFFVGWIMCVGLWVRVVEEEESGERLHPSHGVALHSVCRVTRGQCYCMGCRQPWITDLLQHCSGTDSSLKTSLLSFSHLSPSSLIFHPLHIHWETFYAHCHDNKKLVIPQSCKADWELQASAIAAVLWFKYGFAAQ